MAGVSPSPTRFSQLRSSSSRFAIAVLSAAALAGAGIRPVAAARDITRAEYEACQATNEESFRTAIQAVTFKALQRGIATIDFNALVADEWRRAQFDELIDKRVDLAVAEVKGESSWAQLLQSLGSKEKAQELAIAVAERVYRSDAMKTSIEGLAVGVGKEVGKAIELATADAAEPAIQCLKAFLGGRFGTTVAQAVTSEAGEEFAVDPSKGGARVSTGSVLLEGKEGIAGAMVLLVRRQLSNMAARIGQRIVGSVLSRLVSVAAGGVGIVLIAKDVWDFRHGVMPIIAAEMKSKDTKIKVQDELARTISEQIGESLKDVATTTGDRIVELWREFRRAHAKVLDLAERSEPFRRFLDAARPAQLPRVDEIVGLVLGSEGEAGVAKRLENGTLYQAINTMPVAGLEIARESRSLETALSWHALAGDALAKVLDNEIHRRAKPGDFSKASLTRVLGLGDKTAITRMASIDRPARDALFEVSDRELMSLARGLSEQELSTLAGYLTGLGKDASQRVLIAVAAAPVKMQSLGSPWVRDAVLSSRDHDAAVAMMLRTDSGLDPTVVTDDLRLAWEGRINPLLLWSKHPTALVGLGLGGLIVLLLLRRLLFPRRRTA